MKIKILYFAVLIIFCVSLTGCIFRSKSRVERFSEEMASEQKKSDEIMENVITSLENGDIQALKEMYASAALESTPNIDDMLEELTDFYEGTMEEYAGDSSSSTEYRSGKQVVEFKGQYKVTTTKEKYRVFFNHKPVNDINPEEIGLYYVEFVSEEDYEKEVEENGHYVWTYGTQKTGAYCPNNRLL